MDEFIPQDFRNFTPKYFFRYTDFSHPNSLLLNNLIERVIDSQGSNTIIKIKAPKNKIFPPLNSA
jgi:hypothetical protein